MSICESATPAMPAIPEPRPKVSASTRAGADAHRGRHRAVLRHGAHFKAEPRKAQQPEQRGKDRERKADDPQPIVGDRDLAKLEGAAHPRRIADVLVGRAERGAHGLLQNERETPGREQRFQRPTVEKPDDALLDQDADQSGKEKCQGNREHERIVGERGKFGAEYFLHDVRHVGAEHDHFAVRHVDDAHDAEGDGEADRGEQQNRAKRKAVPGVLHGGPDGELVLDGGHRVLRGARRRRQACPAGRPDSSASAS